MYRKIASANVLHVEFKASYQEINVFCHPNRLLFCKEKKMTVIDIYKRPPQIKFSTESNKKDSEHKACIELFFNT